MIDAAVEHGTLEGVGTVVLRAGRPGADLAATFAPGAGMVCCSLRHRGEELLGRRGGLAAYLERGSSFGIPLLHPWANRLARLPWGESPRVRRDSGGLPIHGLLAAHPGWEVLDADVTIDGARLRTRLDFAAHDDLLAAFPFPHTITVTALLGAVRLSLTTTIEATGDVAVPLAFGWHPYLTLPGLARERWVVGMPVRRRHLLDERGLPTGATEPVRARPAALRDRVLDDLFDELAAPGVFTLGGGGRHVSVTFGEGYPVAQVYAPAGEDFICFEPMTAPTNALAAGTAPTVGPGETFSARFSVGVVDDDAD